MAELSTWEVDCSTLKWEEGLKYWLFSGMETGRVAGEVLEELSEL